MESALTLVLVLPLAGVFFGLLLGRRMPERVVGWIASLLVGSAFVSALLAVRGLTAAHPDAGGLRVVLFEWMRAGGFGVDAALWLDPLSGVMILMVTGVSFLIHVYSIGYMHGDEGYGRYFTYLNLFTFSMLLLVLGDSLALLFVGWEGVGLCSYLLIGFWFERDSAADAGNKAFIVNRIGDAAFIVGMLALVALFGTLDIQRILHEAPSVLTTGTATLVVLLLFFGATGKSAQIPLHIWLPDAMEGPTPVSALIHAATMVTAGVYLLARLAPLLLLTPVAMTVVAVVGGLTALVLGSVGLAQYDIKRVLAYSTISQLGFMFLAVGVGAFAVAIFHLVMHAFFKALLFMGAGSVMHAVDDRQDMREMGGLKDALPITHITMLAGALALAGIPVFAGFFSKDEILYEAWAGPNGSPLLWLLGAVTAVITALYIFRLVYLTFYGESRVPEGVRPHESPAIMTVPLIVLALLSTVGGFSGLPEVLGGGAWFQSYLGSAVGAAGHGAGATHGAAGAAAHGPAGLQLALMAASVLLALTGWLVARRWYAADPFPERPARAVPGLWGVLKQKFYFDEFYFLFVVSPLRGASKWFYRVLDVSGIDAAVRGAGSATAVLGRWVAGLQQGHVGSYALAVAAGTVLLLLFVII